MAIVPRFEYCHGDTESTGARMATMKVLDNNQTQMELNVLAFGIAREIFGSNSIKMEVKSSCTVKELKHELEEKFPRLKQLSSFMIAVNDKYASPEEIVTRRDEIAVIPPVSGG